jgi:hypothetical protein
MEKNESCPVFFSAIGSLPGLDTVAEMGGSNDERNAWLPDSRAVITGAWVAADFPGRYPVHLVQRCRPEAAYGIMWLPQFWLMVFGLGASAWLIQRDLRRWRLAPPFPQP